MIGKRAAAQPEEKATKAALRLLRFRPRSVWELSARLRQKFGDKTSRSVIQALQEKRLLDDHAFSRFWIENRVQFKPMGKARLFQELRAKGVPPGIIQEALASFHPGEDREIAERLLEARRKRMNPKDPKSPMRLYRYLRSRGFSHDLASELLKKDFTRNVPEDDGE